MLVRVLLAIDDTRLRARLRRTLAQNDVLVESVENSERVWTELARAACDMVVVSRALVPDPVVESLQSFKSLPDAPEVVILDENEDPENRARWMAAGCHAVLAPNLSSTALRDVMHALLGRQRSAAATKLFAGRTMTEPRLSDFITSSAAMHTFMSLVNRVVASDTSLLILGETGVGKEHLARAIHAESPRASGPFIAVNCGALPEALLESELFGHEQGAFTGATRSRRGCFELAHRGVLFLDEIGELPHHLQVKLLHVLQRREIQRLGSESAFGVDVRVIAATNRDIESEVEEKRFRTDLYYRLSVVTLAIPPLRDRIEDIAVLTDSYLDYFRGHIRRNVTGITREALDALRGYDWPGNVRELVNIIERAMLLCTGEDIQLDDLPESIRKLGPAYVPRAIPTGAMASPDALAPALLRKPLREAREAVLADFEMNYLAGLLRETGGKVGETARRAGIEPRSLFDKMKRFGLKKEAFRAAKAE